MNQDTFVIDRMQFVRISNQFFAQEGSLDVLAFGLEGASPS